MRSVYVTSHGAFLPGPPIENDQVEQVLGAVHGQPSRLRRRIQRANRIETRHYALDAEQRTTMANEELAARAISACFDRASLDRRDVELLAVATSQGDLLLPGFGSMVHGASELPPCQLITTTGVCNAGMMALKAAFDAVRTGDAANAVVCASELVSRCLKRSRYEAVFAPDAPLDADSEFLRWTLSDGAGALLVEARPRPRRVSLRIDWMRVMSYASRYPVCMTVGRSRSDTTHGSWQDYPTYADAERAGAILLRQDLGLLDDVVRVGVELYLRLIEEGRIVPERVRHVLCHYSSHQFRGRIHELLKLAGAMIPEERWYTNLYTRGNTGSASMFVMLDEFLSADRLAPGDTVVCMVPESGRFSAAYMHLTAVEADAEGRVLHEPEAKP
jgi:3-oxoacyl-[acyl-carrier-protein] synthase-3